MIKVFISQAMTGLSEDEILNKRKSIEKYLKKSLKDNIAIIDSYITDAPENASDIWYIGQSILKLDTADLIVFSKNWETSRGCQIEFQVAMRYNKQMLFLTNL